VRAPLGELGRDLVPAGVVLRVTVDEQQRRSGTTVAQKDDGAARPYIEVPEAREVHRHRPRTPTCRINAIVSLGRNGDHLARNICHGSDSCS
jgi:hypothetical protein